MSGRLLDLFFSPLPIRLVILGLFYLVVVRIQAGQVPFS
jgi:hypothetical protein